MKQHSNMNQRAHASKTFRLLLASAVMIILLTAVIGSARSQKDKTKEKWVFNREFNSAVDSVFSFIEADSPGCAVGIVRKGRLVFSRCYGLANLEWQTPITEEVVFNIASTSKQFTATGILLLESDGLLSLGDDIRTYLPEMPDFGTTITIRHLMHHTSGLRDYLDLRTLTGKPYTDFVDVEDIVEQLVQQRALNFKPGTDHRYCNSGYVLMAAIVEKVSGMTLGDFCTERIFKPLGMAHTLIGDDHQKVIPHRATAYTPRDDGFAMLHHWNNEVVGAGNLFTTLNDLALWDNNFNKPQVGDSALHRKLLKRGMLASGDTLDYAGGLVIGQYRGLPTIRHGGSSGGFRCELLRFPQEHLSVICLANRSDAEADFLAEKVADLVFSDQFIEPGIEETNSNEQPETPTDETTFALLDFDQSSWIGTYRRDDPVSYLMVSEQEQQLTLMIIALASPLTLHSATRAIADNFAASVEFRPPEHEKPAEINLNGGRPRKRIKESNPTQPTLKQFTGVYSSTELAVVYRISMEEGKLKLHLPVFEPVEIFLGDEDELFTMDWILKFHRDQENRISGFRIDTGRVSGIQFIRQGDP